MTAPGELVRFNGRRCLHFTKPNLTTRTRVSLDFRVVPGSLFDQTNRLSRKGYFSSAVAVAGSNGDGGGRRWVKERMGRVSLLHGMPHTCSPTEE